MVPGGGAAPVAAPGRPRPLAGQRGHRRGAGVHRRLVRVRPAVARHRQLRSGGGGGDSGRVAAGVRASAPAVDKAGHRQGAASAQYRAGGRRGRCLLDRLLAVAPPTAGRALAGAVRSRPAPARRARRRRAGDPDRARLSGGWAAAVAGRGSRADPPGRCCRGRCSIRWHCRPCRGRWDARWLLRSRHPDPGATLAAAARRAGPSRRCLLAVLALLVAMAWIRFRPLWLPAVWMAWLPLAWLSLVMAVAGPRCRTRRSIPRRAGT